MKSSVIRLFTLIFISASVIGSASAQQQAQGQQQQQHSKKTPEQQVEKRLEKMKAELNLTDEQVPKVKEVLMAHANMKETKEGGGNPEAAKETHKQVMADLSKILTPEQMTKLKQMQAESKQQKQGTTPGSNQPMK